MSRDLYLMFHGPTVDLKIEWNWTCCSLTQSVPTNTLYRLDKEQPCIPIRKE